MAALMGIFAGAQQGVPNGSQMIDPSTILYSMSTIADEMAPLEPMTAQPTEDDMVLHEDEWRQIEFFPGSRVEEVRRTLTELARFEEANRTESGFFRQVFIRREPPPVPVTGTVEALAAELGTSVSSGPVFFTAQSIIGRGANGFTLRLAGNVSLYGYSDRPGIMVLGAIVGDGGDHAVLAHTFMALNRSHGLIAVDWRSHMLLAGVSTNGQLEVWRPD